MITQKQQTKEPQKQQTKEQQKEQEIKQKILSRSANKQILIEFAKLTNDCTILLNILSFHTDFSPKEHRLIESKLRNLLMQKLRIHVNALSPYTDGMKIEPLIKKDAGMITHWRTTYESVKTLLQQFNRTDDSWFRTVLTPSSLYYSIALECVRFYEIFRSPFWKDLSDALHHQIYTLACRMILEIEECISISNAHPPFHKLYNNLRTEYDNRIYRLIRRLRELERQKQGRQRQQMSRHQQNF